jgi:uncharacterized membrane protein
MSALRRQPAWVRLVVSTFIGLVTGAVMGFHAHWQLALLAGWVATALTFLLLAWLAVHGLDAEATWELAGREDPSRAVTDLILIVASVASLGSVALVIASAGKAGSAASLAQVGLGVLSVVASWAMVHTLYTLRYARLYFIDGDEGGIEFNSPDRPQYSDFAYVAFTLGMTYQVSDTALKTASLRATALKQAVLSYLFGAVIIAITINLVAGLLK